MVTISDTPVLFSLSNTEYSDGDNSDADNSEPINANFFVPKVQESGKISEPQPSCSGLHLKPQPRSLSKSRKVAKPSFPWKLVLPKRGISKLIFQVVASTERRGGISLQGIKKCVVATGYDLERRKHYFKRVMRALLAKGLLRKLTGRGLTGSYAVSGMMRKVMRRRQQRRRKRTSGLRKKRAAKGKGKPRKKKAKATEPEISSDTNTVTC